VVLDCTGNGFHPLWDDMHYPMLKKGRRFDRSLHAGRGRDRLFAIGYDAYKGMHIGPGLCCCYLNCSRVFARRAQTHLPRYETPEKGTARGSWALSSYGGELSTGVRQLVHGCEAICEGGKASSRRGEASSSRKIIVRGDMDAPRWNLHLTVSWIHNKKGFLLCLVDHTHPHTSSSRLS
jgi:hypothetical protein